MQKSTYPMKSRKYPTLQAALDHLKSIGTLTYGGWEGQRDGYYIYTLETGGKRYVIGIYKDGKVELIGVVK